MGNGADKLYWDHLVYSQDRRSSRVASQTGLRDFVGVIVSATLFTVLLAVGAGECGRSLIDVDQSSRVERGEGLLRDLRHAVSAYPFDGIAGGSKEFERQISANPGFELDLGVTPVRADLLRVEAVLTDKWTSEPVGRFVTYRRQS